MPWAKASGNILVSASDAMQIDATSTASAITVAISLKGSLAFSGGGATAVNRILGHTNATVTSSKLEAGGTLAVQYERDEDTGKGNPLKVYKAQYRAPAPAAMSASDLI